MDRSSALAETIAVRLIERKQTVAVAEGSAGGLISAALLAVPGASAYFVSGAVVYTGAARGALAGIALEEMQAAKIRPASEPYAALLARRMRERLETTWGLAEAGAAGPTGNRYGDPAGHTCIAVSGPSEKTATLRTGSSDRRANMQAFAVRALELFAERIGAK
jgi:nicotinamide-nucleotide amidase